MREMQHWPEYTTPNEKIYTLKHVAMLETTLGFCKSFRTAVQAGGSIGYWPRRMAEKFDRVITFEPEAEIRECLVKNLAAHSNVTVRSEALAATPGRCAIQRRGFGSHVVVVGDSVDAIKLDSLALDDLDLLQLDIEGHEIFALWGGSDTLKRCRPLIQVELLGIGGSPSPESCAVIEWMRAEGYREVAKMGRDHVFSPA